MNKFLFALALSAFLLVPQSQANPVDNHAAMTAGADRMLAIQLETGAFPWVVGSSAEYQNVQGISAIGLLRAFELTGDLDYMGNATSGAQATRDWIVNYMAANPTAFVSSSNAFFLADYARVTGSVLDYQDARDAMNRAVSRWGTADNFVDTIIPARAAQGWTNLGIWDVALFIRAAQEVGFNTFADELSEALVAQDYVDPFNATNNAYELGLAGLMFGLAESNYLDFETTILSARDALVASQCADGSFPFTWNNVVYCEDVQTTAYGVMGLTAILDVEAAESACDFLVSAQDASGGYDLGGYEIAEVQSEAVVALASCIAPLNNAVTSYGDMVRGII